MYTPTHPLRLRGRLPKRSFDQGPGGGEVGMPHPLAQGTQGNMQGTSGAPATGRRIFALFCAAPKQASRPPTDLSPLFVCLLPVAAPSSLIPSRDPPCLASHFHQRNDQLSLASCPSSPTCTLPLPHHLLVQVGSGLAPRLIPYSAISVCPPPLGRVFCLPWLHV